MTKLTKLIASLIKREFWGKLTISFEGGRIIGKARIEETIDYETIKP